MGMGQRLQAFRRLLQGVQRRQRGQFFGVEVSVLMLVNNIVIYRHVNI